MHRLWMGVNEKASVCGGFLNTFWGHCSQSDPLFTCCLSSEAFHPSLTVKGSISFSPTLWP